MSAQGIEVGPVLDVEQKRESCEKLAQSTDDSGHNLKALLGLNLGSDKSETVPLGVLKVNVASKPISAGSENGRSVSFSTPEVSTDPFSRAVGTARDQNIPLLDRMMSGGPSSRLDPGYGSLEFSNFAELTQDIKSKSREDLSPPFTKPRVNTPSISQLDLAVANALHNLQTLQQQRASALGDVGVPNLIPRQDMNNNDPDNILSALLATAAQQTAQRQVQMGNFYNEAQSLQLGNYLENAARSYRSAATVHEANCTWSGQLPPRGASSGSGADLCYSSKVFLGGIPWDITEESLLQIFDQFGQVRVEWPGRDITTPPRGYLYITFDSEESVKELLTRCTQDFSNGGSFYYFKISSNRMRSKEVQVIPWAISDTNFVSGPTVRLDPMKTVFVGALHGMMNAEGLAIVFNDLFGGVIYAGLDTDKNKYPIGSGRVTFNNAKSYMKAVTAAFIEIKTPRFSKKVQVDPYLEDALCSTCGTKQGPYFCRDLSCFNYFCRFCWELRHAFIRPQHKPLMRHIRGFNRDRNESLTSLDGRITVPGRTTPSPTSRTMQSPIRGMQSPSRGMATPSREPNLNGERAMPSREAFPGRDVNYPNKEAAAGFTRWDPRKDAPEYDPVLPRAKAMENQRTTPLTLDIFIKNVVREEPVVAAEKKEPNNECLVNEEKIIAETIIEVTKSD